MSKLNSICAKPWELAAYMRWRDGGCKGPFLLVRPVKPRRSEMVCSGDCSGPIMEQAWRDPGLGGGEYLKVPCGDGASQRVFCPFGSIGEVLGIKEAFASIKQGVVAYKAGAECGAWCDDGGGGRLWIHHGLVMESPDYQGRFANDQRWNTYGLGCYGGRWLSPARMPEWAVRHRPTIADIRVMRVQDVSHTDSYAIGAPAGKVPNKGSKLDAALLGFADQFDRDHGNGAWNKSPWCWFLNVVE